MNGEVIGNVWALWLPYIITGILMAVFINLVKMQKPVKMVVNILVATVVVLFLSRYSGEILDVMLSNVSSSIERSDAYQGIKSNTEYTIDALPSIIQDSGYVAPTPPPISNSGSLAAPQAQSQPAPVVNQQAPSAPTPKPTLIVYPIATPTTVVYPTAAPQSNALPGGGAQMPKSGEPQVVVQPLPTRDTSYSPIVGGSGEPQIGIQQDVVKQVEELMRLNPNGPPPNINNLPQNPVRRVEGR